MTATRGLRALAVLGTAAVLMAGCGRDDEGGDTGGGGGGGANAPGVTDTSIKLGTTFALSGPASAYSIIARSSKAHFDYVNSKGGVNGRKIEYTILDDGYEPPRAVNNARRLVTQEKVFAVFNPLGTPPNLAIWDYLNQQKVPHVFVATGASEWGKDIKGHPYTIGWQPDYQVEASAIADYLKREKGGSKIAVLYQNDGFGKDFLSGLEKDLEGADVTIVAKESYEVTDPSVSPQVAKLAGSGADVFVDIATPKPAAQAIGTVAKLGKWKPLHIISNVAASKSLVFTPVGLENAKGIIATNYLKDPESKEFADDPKMMEYKDQLKKFAPKLNPNEPFNVYGWAAAETMIKALEKAGKDLTREGLMKAVRSMDEEIGLLLPGIRVTTDGETDGYPIEQVQLQQFNGDSWDKIGEVFDASAD